MSVDELPANYRPSSSPTSEAKRRCTVTVTQAGWLGAKAAAEAAGCHSISELLEKVARGELCVVQSDQMGPLFDPPSEASPERARVRSRRPNFATLLASELLRSLRRLPKLAITGVSAALILLPLLYVIELTLPDAADPILTGDIPETGDVIAGFDVTDHFRIRPVHPVTGALNVPHNGIDLATPTGTPVYAVGAAGDSVIVDCWWDIDGGGWVADQTAASFPDYVFQSLHLLENECRPGTFKTGDVIALTGNSGLGSGEHYDFRVKVKGTYVPPDKQFVEAALTGTPLPANPRNWLGF
ncbi:MAG: M23 family metallopeptidase [Leptolyngbya sp. SIO4C1]|nr:M23 family metallopeptidase [Leptolyngbya sp. SIO4C1]